MKTSCPRCKKPCTSEEIEKLGNCVDCECGGADENHDPDMEKEGSYRRYEVEGDPSPPANKKWSLVAGVPFLVTVCPPMPAYAPAVLNGMMPSRGDYSGRVGTEGVAQRNATEGSFGFDESRFDK